MRHARLAFAAFLLVAGCNLFKPLNDNKDPGPAQPPNQQPTAEALVTYLNDNARRIQSIDCAELNIDAHARSEGVNLADCWMTCQKPRNFRMMAKIIGSNGVDLGSNDAEFWWWISKSEPPGLFRCSYEDLQNKQIRMPFPFQPEWIMEGLGMAEYGPPANYTVNATANSVELIETTKAPSGAMVRKVTVFARNAGANMPVVKAHILQDANGKVICAAYIDEIQRDAASGAVVPKKMRLEWPDEKMELRMNLKKIVVNPAIDAQKSARLFSRPQLQGVPVYDLARGKEQMQRAVVPAAGTEPQR